MIRKQTWILLVIFLILAGGAFYLQKNPIKSLANVTPSPTPQASVLKGWLASDIMQIEYKNDNNETLQLEQDAQGYWVLQPNGLTVDLGKVEEIRTQIVDLQVITNLDPGYDLSGTGLDAPTGVLTITNKDGKKAEIRIGAKTPTGTSYYLKVDDEAPTVCNSGAVNTLVGLLSLQNLNPTPTPAMTPSPEVTETPA